MFSISAPLINNTINENNREDILTTLKKCKVSRIFIAIGSSRFLNELSDEDFEQLKDNCAYFRANGIKVVIWQGYTIGHGIPLSHDKPNQVKYEFTNLTTASGQELADTYCPLDENFRKAVCLYLKRIATAGADTILLDDDFRLSERQDELDSITCCCQKHLEKMSEVCGEPVTLDIIKDKVLSGKPNKYRDAWEKVQGDSLRTFAREIRKAVDEVDKSVRVALCSCWSHWDVDGADALELTKILAGENKPLLRLHGAPYWEKFGSYGATLCSSIELEKMLHSFCKNRDVELISEGDVYPRPRYNIPSSHLETFDGALRAFGEFDGILKYMFDYTSPVGYEEGYINAHLSNLSKFENLSEKFQNAQNEGVRVYAFPHLFTKMDIRNERYSLLGNSPRWYGAILSENSIPTVYEGEGLCACVMGVNAEMVSLDDIKHGAIIDSEAAKILHARGVDVGVKSFKSNFETNVGIENYSDGVVTVSSNCKVMLCDYKTVKVESYFESEGEKIITSYSYQNELGQKFFVLCYPALDTKVAMRVNYYRQENLKNAVEWISGKKLPAFVAKAPYLYCVTKRKEGKVFVAMFNCYMDDIFYPFVQLDRHYDSVTFINGKGRLDGDKIIIDEEIAPYKFVAFILE